MPAWETYLPSAPPLGKRTNPIVSFVGSFSKLILSRWCKSVNVRGLDGFLRTLRDEERRKSGRGILTYANHISVMDDPTLFGCMPKDTYRDPALTRWTLGARDIMFTNPFFGSSFRSGQVLCTDRGRGVFQPSIDKSIDLLEAGAWVHIFPEGYVNMSRKARCRRFKWGVGRMLLEAGRSAFGKSAAGSASSSLPPLVVPIWITGFDAMMPEPRGNPRWLPRPGANITIDIGQPINAALDPLLDALSSPLASSSKGTLSLEECISHLKTLSGSYPPPPEKLFSERTPLVPPPGGVPWPVPLAESRSAHALEKLAADSDLARQARSMISNELRAHLVKLGAEAREAGGVSDDLVHRLMEAEDDETVR